MLSDILRIASAACVPERGSSLVQLLSARVEAVRRQAERAEFKPRVACIEWLEPPMIAGNWIPDLVRRAGGAPLELRDDKSEYVAWADIEAFAPQIVILLPCGFDLARTVVEAEGLESVPEWNRIAGAAKVFPVDGSAYFNRPGPRLIDSLEMLAGIIHPAIFRASPNANAGAALWKSLT